MTTITTIARQLRRLMCLCSIFILISITYYGVNAICFTISPSHLTGEDAAEDEKKYPAFLILYGKHEETEGFNPRCKQSSPHDGLKYEAREHYSDLIASGVSMECCEDEARCDENRLTENPLVEEPHQQSAVCKSERRDNNIMYSELNNGATVVASNGEQLYKCVACKKAFFRKADLVAHKRTHAGGRPYICVQCNKAYTRKANLEVHERRHTGERPYKCSKCDETFARKASLVAHEGTHTGERPYECAKCDKTFTRNKYLVAHEGTHTGERPYECGKCDKAFTRKACLVRHEYTHTGERPYECVKCDKAFTRKAGLVHHEYTHTGERPYKCAKCDKAFNKTSRLVAHDRTHTDENDLTSVSNVTRHSFESQT